MAPPTITDAGPETTAEPAATTASERRSGSLKPALDVIPPEAYENPTWKGLAYFGRDLLLYLGFGTALVLVSNPLLALPLIVLMALTVSALFVVGHDAAHGALFRSKRLNSIVGHIAMLPSLHVYEGWLLGHNRIHHGYTVRQGFDFVWHPVTVEEYRAMGRFGRLRHRLEWSWLGAGAYYGREVWWNKMVTAKMPDRFAAGVRRDRWIVLGFVVAMVAALGALGWAETGTVAGAAWLVARVFVLPLLGFQYIIGSVVHVHHIQPDIRWWSRREWTKFKGQMEGTTILRVPKGYNVFFHWIMIHVPHHVDMRIPMYNLELAGDALKAAFPDVVHDEPLRFRDFVANTKQCKLYDFEGGRWLTYDAVAPAS